MRRRIQGEKEIPFRLNLLGILNFTTQYLLEDFTYSTTKVLLF